MNALVLGTGGREHALARKLAESPLVSQVFVAPGNGGTATHFTNLEVDLDNFEAIAARMLSQKIDLVLIGPEKPLVDGLVDFLNTHSNPSIRKINVIGPDKACAQLEGSKAFSKMIMEKANIPTAKAKEFGRNDWQLCKEYIENHSLPMVIKADGLASGKGVAVCTSIEEAIEFSSRILLNSEFGEENNHLLVEDFLDGIEVSMFLLTDGTHYIMLPEAKDYKRIFDGDQGPNTGGMGSVSPVPFVDEDFIKKVENRIIEPLFKTLKEENYLYTGFLFIGLMNCGGEPWVIEFNVRLGDPETQTILQRISGDIVPSLLAIKTCTLNKHSLIISPSAAATVVLCSENYPDNPVLGKEITIGEIPSNSILFHSGSQLDSNSKLVNSGGRVFGCTGIGNSIQLAINHAYQCVSQVQFEGVLCRKDIGQDVLKWKV